MDGKTHRKVGKLAGALTTLMYMEASDDPVDVALSLVGGYWAGAAGAALPDIFEPAIHSFHRDVMHSYTFGTVGSVAARPVIEKWRAYCRQNASNAAQRRLVPGVTPADFWASLAEELFWKIAVGFASGIAAGYVSHLMLDAATPRGIPLLTRGT